MTKVVILAGGKGTRLKPYTITLPKPLVPLGNKSVMEILLENLKNQGFKDITVSVGYHADLIKSYFNNGSKFGVNLTYIEEKEPLSTAGPLKLLKNNEITDPIIIINGDTVTSLNLNELIDAHKKSGAAMTVVVKKVKNLINFGVIDIDSNNMITDYREKPSNDHIVSIGIYVVDPKVLDHIATGEKIGMPDLVLRLIKNGNKVHAFATEKEWFDFGRPEDYERALDTIEKALR